MFKVNMNDNINLVKKYFENNYNSIADKFIEIPNEEEEDLGGIQVFSVLNILNIKWKKPSINEFSNQEIIFILHHGVISMIIYSNFYSIILFIYLCGVIATSFGISFAIIAYSLNCMRHLNLNKEKIEKLMKEEKEYEESFQFKYMIFFNDYIEKMHDVYNDETKMNKEFKNQDKNFLKSLKEKTEHYEIKLPFEKNKKMIMYYDIEDETFYYYTQNSDVLYIVLNRCCQEYVYNKKCINLFKDEEEIKYIKSLDEDKEKEKEEIIKSYEEINKDEKEEKDDDKEEKDDDKEEKEEPKSIFYKNEKKETEKKENIEKNQKVLNKFIRKGTIDDYNIDFKKKKESKVLNYEEYMKIFKK